MDTVKIEHDADAHRFVVKVGDEEATLNYARQGDVLNIYHVYVPPSQRGRGLAEQITKAAFEYARQEGLKVAPTCPYVAHGFLRRFSQYRTLVA